MSQTATDQRGEQTINRDAKVAGGIKAFATNESSILKWTLNRSEQTTVTSELNKVAGIKDVIKNICPSQISKSEKKIAKLINVLS